MFSGKHLKMLRTEAGFSQKALAEGIGISRETVVAIENEYEGTIGALYIIVVRDWWLICRKKVSTQTQVLFKEQLLRFFYLNITEEAKEFGMPNFMD